MTCKRSCVSFQWCGEMAQTDAFFVTRLLSTEEVYTRETRPGPQRVKWRWPGITKTSVGVNALLFFLWLQNSDLIINSLMFPILGKNHGEILRSSHALTISFLWITGQAYTYHDFWVWRMRLKPSPLKWQELLSSALGFVANGGGIRHSRCSAVSVSPLLSWCATEISWGP